MLNKRLFILYVLFALFTSAFGQKKFSKVSIADFATPAEAADSSADAVYIYNIGDTHFEISPTGFKMQTQVKVRMMILTEKGKDYANQSVVYHSSDKGSSFNNDKVLNISAASYNLVDGKVVKTSMSGKYEFVEKVDDYTKRTKFSIPEVKVGSIIEYKYTLVSPRYTYIPTWYMQMDDPVRYNYYTVTIPEWFKYQVEQRGSNNAKFNKDRTTLQANLQGQIATIEATRYTVEAENIKSFKHEKLIYCKKDYMQRMDFELSGIEIPGEVYKNYTNTWADVRKFMEGEYDFGSNLKIKNPYSAEMASLALDGKPSSAKASILFSLLKSKLKWDKTYNLYAKPSKAIKEGKGSNADLNFVYMAMLRDAGIKATPMLIRLRDNGRLPVTHASSDKLNTFVVAIVDDSGALLFADCSADYGDINILPDELMAEGILYDPFVTETPNAGATRGDIYDLSEIRGNSTNTRINCIVDANGELAGQRINTHIGYNALNYKEAYHAVEDSIALIEKIEKNLECKLASFRAKNVNGIGRATEERIRFTKKSMVDGDKIYFNPLVFPDEKTNYFKEAERLLPVEFPAAQTTTITSAITIPEGYAIEEMPKPETIQLPGYLAVAITFEMQDNNLVTKYQSIVDNTFIPATEYAKLQEFWKGVLKINSMMVCLKKQ